MSYFKAIIVISIIGLSSFLFTFVIAGELDELSGVEVAPEGLYMVGDGSDNLLFFIEKKKFINKKGYFKINDPLPISINASKNADDLESVDLLNGKPIVLSEDSSCLFSLDSMIVDYSSIITEKKNRGLEGLSIRPVSLDSVQVAILFEGDLRKKRNKHPFILVHNLSIHPEKIYIPDEKLNNYQIIQLKGDDLQNELDISNKVPLRATDLIWYPYYEKKNLGFIVLLSSGKKKYWSYKWLCRIRGNKRDYYDLLSLVGENISSLNWEGLSWIDENRLIMCADDGFRLHLYILDLPVDW